MTNADPARRMKMRRAIGRMRVQNDRQSTWHHGLGSSEDKLKRPNVMLNKSKEGTPEAVKRDLLVRRRS
jgi:hypothetical protein